jgi:hypothetical protein
MPGRRQIDEVNVSDAKARTGSKMAVPENDHEGIPGLRQSTAVELSAAARKATARDA